MQTGKKFQIFYPEGERNQRMAVDLEMEGNGTSTLLTALKLDEHPLNNQFLYVEELNNADGSFILSVLIKCQIEKNQNVVLVLCHNSFGHFHSIGQKLGYNLTNLRESGQVYVVNILEKIYSEDFLSSTSPLKHLYAEIKKQVDGWENKNGVCILVENIGNFLFTDTKDFLTFINYLRAITFEHNNSNLVLSLHNFPDCSNFCKMAKSIRHVADVTVILNDLQTGRASDVTGHLTLIRREKNFEKTTAEYQYQLQDKSVFVFAPGSRNFL